MRIVLVVESACAGVGRHVRSLATDSACAGETVFVAYAPHRMDRAFRQFVLTPQKGIEFRVLPMKREIAPGSDARALLGLLGWARQIRPHVIHGHSSKGGALARIVGRLLAIPTVYTPHSLVLASPLLKPHRRLAYNAIESILGRLATSLLVAVSEEERELVLGHGLVPARRVQVIENGIDDSDALELWQRPRPQSTSMLTFGSAMRFSQQKDPLNLIRAYAFFRQQRPALASRLLIAGQGEMLHQVESAVLQYQLGDHVQLLGWCDDVAQLLANLDIFVLPSRYEGFSYAILEAMAAGLPVISTQVCGVRESVARVSGNRVVPVADHQLLGTAMVKMAEQDPTTRRQIGAENQALVRSCFAQSTISARTLKAYQKIVRPL